MTTPTAPKTLWLVPTAMELERLTELGGLPGSAPEIVGFGPVAAAARAAQLFERHRPDRAVLVGIAGAYGPTARVGTALRFGRVQLDGLGAGLPPHFVPPSRMGFAQWSDEDGEVFEELELAGEGPTLVTVCAASADADQAARRASLRHDATGEDMESFGVALAARIAGIPLSVVRGFSNIAGDRDGGHWDIESALSAALDLAHSMERVR